MQSDDQRRVFCRLPNGKRKIVLSTNLAETSITIDDIVYVIDTGKVKVKSYDALTGVSALQSEWVSQVNGYLFSANWLSIIITTTTNSELHRIKLKYTAIYNIFDEIF